MCSIWVRWNGQRKRCYDDGNDDDDVGKMLIYDFRSNKTKGFALAWMRWHIVVVFFGMVESVSDRD